MELIAILKILRNVDKVLFGLCYKQEAILSDPAAWYLPTFAYSYEATVAKNFSVPFGVTSLELPMLYVKHFLFLFS